MRITSIMILIFLLVAFSIGISISNSDLSLVDNSINNASRSIENIDLVSSAPNNSKIPNIGGFYLILEKYIKFIGTFAFEIMRAGITFGHDNPEYFEAQTILNVVKLIIILVIISLLIKPTMYLIIMFILVGMWLLDKLKKRRVKQNDKL